MSKRLPMIGLPPEGVFLFAAGIVALHSYSLYFQLSFFECFLIFQMIPEQRNDMQSAGWWLGGSVVLLQVTMLFSITSAFKNESPYGTKRVFWFNSSV
jgi:hypothetical protein